MIHQLSQSVCFALAFRSEFLRSDLPMGRGAYANYQTAVSNLMGVENAEFLAVCDLMDSMESFAQRIVSQ